MKRFILLTALALLLFYPGLSCAPRNDTFPSLSNQGILPLSFDNPYVGANLFLAREMEASPYLMNFISRRGVPLALEIIEPPLDAPQLFLFYPKEREVYAADIQKHGTFHEWIVRGPFSVERKDFRQLARVAGNAARSPALLLFGQQSHLGPQAQPPQLHVSRVLLPVIPTPRPKPRPKPKKEASEVIVQKSAEEKVLELSEKPGEFKPLNSDQQAIAMSKGFAERASNGDAIHTVKGGQETLAAIAKWYTGSADNAAGLAELNSLPPEQPLAPGARVRVPFAKLKNTKAMPQDAK